MSSDRWSACGVGGVRTHKVLQRAHCALPQLHPSHSLSSTRSLVITPTLFRSHRREAELEEIQMERDWYDAEEFGGTGE